MSTALKMMLSILAQLSYVCLLLWCFRRFDPPQSILARMLVCVTILLTYMSLVVVLTRWVFPPQPETIIIYIIGG